MSRYETSGSSRPSKNRTCAIREQLDELRNVVDESQYADVLKDLKAQLEQLRKQYQDPDDTRPYPGPGLTQWPPGQRPGGPYPTPRTSAPARQPAGSSNQRRCSKSAETRSPGPGRSGVDGPASSARASAR